jgi:hypothetical protein
MEWLLGDDDVWSPVPEYRLKGTITFNPTVGLAQTFIEAVFLRVSIKWLLGDEDVCLTVLEYRLKRAITFDPTFGSCSNFSRGCFLGIAME